MAIQTRGFEVTNLPRYTPVNPSLVAFNPTAISDGAMTGFQMARMRQDIEAKRALMEELEALRTDRMAAQRAAYGAQTAKDLSTIRLIPDEEMFRSTHLKTETGLIPKRAGLEEIQIADQSKSIPIVGEATRAGAVFNTALNQGRLGNVRVLNEAEAARAGADIAGDRNRAAMAPLQRQADEARLQLATLQSQLAESNAPIEAQVAAMKASQALANAKSDMEYKRAIEQANLALKESQAEKNLAEADYARGLGRQAAGRNETPQQRAARLQDLIREINNMPVGDNTRTLAVYAADTYSPEEMAGSLMQGKSPTTKTNTFMGFDSLSKDPKRDPIGDMMLRQKQAYERELFQLMQSGALNEPAGNLQAPPTTGLTTGQVVNGYRYIGGDPQKQQSWQKVQ